MSKNNKKLEKEKIIIGQWTCEITIEYVPLPPEKEELYWAAIGYFAEVLFSELVNSEKEVDE